MMKNPKTECCNAEFYDDMEFCVECLKKNPEPMEKE